MTEPPPMQVRQRPTSEPEICPPRCMSDGTPMPKSHISRPLQHCSRRPGSAPPPLPCSALCKHKANRAESRDRGVGVVEMAAPAGRSAQACRGWRVRRPSCTLAIDHALPSGITLQVFRPTVRGTPRKVRSAPFVSDSVDCVRGAAGTASILTGT